MHNSTPCLHATSMLSLHTIYSYFLSAHYPSILSSSTLTFRTSCLHTTLLYFPSARYLSALPVCTLPVRTPRLYATRPHSPSARYLSALRLHTTLPHFLSAYSPTHSQSAHYLSIFPIFMLIFSIAYLPTIFSHFFILPICIEHVHIFYIMVIHALNCAHARFLLYLLSFSMLVVHSLFSFSFYWCGSQAEVVNSSSGSPDSTGSS